MHNRVSRVSLATVVLLSSLSRLAFAAPDENSIVSLKAGAAETIVTPKVGTVLQAARKPSTGINDDLYARALVLADRDRKLVIVTMDFVGFNFAYNERLIQAINKATGIPAENVMINCTHNHSGPPTFPMDAEQKVWDNPIFDELPQRVAQTVEQAIKNLEPATLRVGREPTQIGVNRRAMASWGVTMAPNPHGAHVPWIDLLGAYGKDNRRIGLLFSHAAHPVIVHDTSTLISADYPGLAIRELRKRLSDGVLMFAQGCGGNINASPLQGGIQACAASARNLAHAVTRTRMVDVRPAKLRSASLKLSLPLQAPPSVAECRELVADQPHDKRLRDLLAIAESGKPRFLPFPIRAFAVGDQVCILALPHEMFAEYQLLADKASPFQHTLVFAYTNGCESYVATEKDYRMGDRGGYEASRTGAALVYHHRLPLQANCEKLIHDGIQQLFKQLRKNG
jgi:neutral ceramidase